MKNLHVEKTLERYLTKDLNTERKSSHTAHVELSYLFYADVRSRAVNPPGSLRQAVRHSIDQVIKRSVECCLSWSFR